MSEIFCFVKILNTVNKVMSCIACVSFKRALCQSTVDLWTWGNMFV